MKSVRFGVKKSATKAQRQDLVQRIGVGAPDIRDIIYQVYAGIDKISSDSQGVYLPVAKPGTFLSTAPSDYPIVKCFTFSYSDGHHKQHTATLFVPSGEHCLEVLAQVCNVFFPRCPPSENLVTILAGLDYIDHTSPALTFDKHPHGSHFHVFFFTVEPSDVSQDDTKESENAKSDSEIFLSAEKCVTDVKRSSKGENQVAADADHLEVCVNGELSGLIVQFKALQRPTKSHPHFELEQQQHLHAITQNWNVAPDSLLVDETVGIDIRPKQLEPEPESWELDPGFQRRYKQRCKEMGWKENDSTDPQNPLDWDMDLLVYLSNLSDYTVDASQDAILAVLNVAVMKRLELGYGGREEVIPELKAEDVLKLVKKLVQHKGVVDPMKLMGERSWR